MLGGTPVVQVSVQHSSIVGMVDVLTPQQRHEVMSRVRSRDTKPELLVRRLLHSSGYRYRLHEKGLAGTPDIVFRGRRKVVFINGCFWHSHDCSNGRRSPKSNQAFWSAKRQGTRERDASAVKILEASGWKVLVIWECELKDAELLLRTLQEFLGPTTGCGTRMS